MKAEDLLKGYPGLFCLATAVLVDHCSSSLKPCSPDPLIRLYLLPLLLNEGCFSPILSFLVYKALR